MLRNMVDLKNAEILKDPKITIENLFKLDKSFTCILCYYPNDVFRGKICINYLLVIY